MHRVVPKAFRVEVAPAVWREIGAVPGEDFKRMQAELENVAQLVSAASSRQHARRVHRLRVGAWEGVYELDPDRQVLRLMSVHRP